jgi:thiamine-phosphate pyrophosphorylase
MPLNLPKPIIYLITSGTTTSNTTSDSEDFSQLLELVEAAAAAEIPLLQIREKKLSARLLYELTSRAAALVHGSSTRLLVNDRADIAFAAGADGVHLTSGSLPASVIRQTFGSQLIVAASTHSVAEAQQAQEGGADFVVFGPVFETESKLMFGEPQGLTKLAEVASNLPELPVIAIGGISIDNFDRCIQAGAAGIAAIRLLNNAERLPSVVAELKRSGARTND